MTQQTPSATKANILVVEDNAASREILDFILSSAGYRVSIAAAGEEALRLVVTLSNTEPLVILMDFQMPGLSGCALATRLKQHCKAEIIAMSGSPISEEARRMFDGFLLKPFDIPELKQVLEKALQRVGDSQSSQPISVLNENTFQKLSGGMQPEALRQVYEVCLKDATNRLTEIEEAVQRGDNSSIRKIAHMIQGGLSMLGAEEASLLAQKLESGSSEHGELLVEIKNLRSAFVRLERILMTKF
jgi:CheY-like chemotaxis protein